MFKTLLNRTNSLLQNIEGVRNFARLSHTYYCQPLLSNSYAHQKTLIYKPLQHLKYSERYFTTTSANFSESEPVEESDDKKPAIDPAKDRTKNISPETSIRYLKSAAYKQTYGDEPVWVKYRRNFKGPFTPRKTRKTCIRKGVLSTGNPCPICRDEYLVLDYTNVDLLKQFIHPQTGEIIDSRKTHICQKRLFELEVAVVKAKFYGLLTHEVPFREYDYKEYYPNWKE